MRSSTFPTSRGFGLAAVLCVTVSLAVIAPSHLPIDVRLNDPIRAVVTIQCAPPQNIRLRLSGAQKIFDVANVRLWLCIDLFQGADTTFKQGVAIFNFSLQTCQV